MIFHIVCLCVVRKYRKAAMETFDAMDDQLTGINSCLDARNQISVAGATLENLNLDYLVGLNLASFIHFFVPLIPLILVAIFYLIKEACRDRNSAYAYRSEMSNVGFLKTFKQDMREQFELFMKNG